MELGFPDFNDFSVNSRKPMAMVLVRTQKRSWICKRALAVDLSTHVVVIYHEQRGSYLGSCVTKCCRNCKVYEHYGYWTKEGKRHFNDDCLKKHLLSSEDTAFQTTFVKQCANFLVVGAVPFATFAQVFNRRF